MIPKSESNEMHMKYVTAALFGAFLATGSANAATCTHAGQGTVFTIEAAADVQCMNGNDTNTINASSEFFGLTGWTLAAKNEGGGDGNGQLSFSLAPVNGDQSGLWEILNPNNYANVFITLKAGTGFGAFLLDSGTEIAGDWSSSKELSHASIYYQGEPGGPAPIPLPAAGVLLAGALGALALRRRKRG